MTELTTLSLTLLVAAAIFLVAALVLTLWPRAAAAVPAFVAMVLLHLGHLVIEPAWRLVIWGLAMVVCVCLRRMQPKGEPDGRLTGNLYVALAALAGALAGMAAGVNFILLGTILGAFMGMMAYSRTPHGSWLKTRGGTMVQYFCAKGLPAIVAVAITVTCIEGLIFYFQGFHKYL